MADEPLKDSILSSVESIAIEAVPLSIAPKKWLSFKTAVAYYKTMKTAVSTCFVTLAAFISGASPAISQTQPVRVEDVGPHIPAQGHGTAEPMRSVIVAAATSGDAISLDGFEVREDLGVYRAGPIGSIDRTTLLEIQDIDDHSGSQAAS